jgi:hypothetical protein
VCVIRVYVHEYLFEYLYTYIVCVCARVYAYTHTHDGISSCESCVRASGIKPPPPSPALARLHIRVCVCVCVCVCVPLHPFASRTKSQFTYMDTPLGLKARHRRNLPPSWNRCVAAQHIPAICKGRDQLRQRHLLIHTCVCMQHPFGLFPVLLQENACV